MVAPLVSAAGRVVAKKVTKKVANKKMVGQAANGVKNAEKITRIYRAANDNKKSEPSSNDNDNTLNNDRDRNKDFKITKVSKTKRTNNHVNSPYDQTNVAQLTNTPGRYTQARGKMKGIIKNKLRKSTWFTVWPIVSIASPVQFFAGILTFVTFGFWTTLESWTWGISEYVIPSDEIFSVVWIFTITIGLLSLTAVVLIFTLIGRLSLVNQPITFGAFVILFALAIFPLTSFLPSAAIFSIIVFLVFRKSS